ncbi:WbuC family cupin fold metalloprotein [Escherichia coli]
MRPHRHPHTFELLLPLRGRFVVLNFDDRGTVTHRAILGETCTVLEMAAGTWHAVLSLDTGGIIFEVKHGGYQPVAADDYAHWAPAEGEPGTTELMAWYAQAQVATALLPSKAINKNGMSFPIPFPLLQTVGDDFSRRR